MAGAGMDFLARMIMEAFKRENDMQKARPSTLASPLRVLQPPRVALSCRVTMEETGTHINTHPADSHHPTQDVEPAATGKV